MSESFSTISSKKKHRYFAIGLIILIYFPTLASYSIFLYKPSLFYFRAWEYFSEIVYQNPGKLSVWAGSEKGDLSRNFFFRYQDEKYTYVSTDRDGFRNVPFPSDNYEILVYGDSHCWGSGLSDHETFAWRLAKRLNHPIFNGGRSPLLEKLINRIDIQKAKVIINVIDSFHVRIKEIFPHDFTIKAYLPLTNQVVPIAVKRFFLPSILSQTIKRISYDLISGNKLNDYMTSEKYIVPFSEGDLNQDYVKKDPIYDDDSASQIERIVKFNQRLKELGYTYVLVLVPRRDLIYGRPVDDFSKEYFPKMIQKLEKEGVYAIDLQSLFLEHKREEPFFRTDTHWNARGTELAADYVAGYLIQNGIVNELSRAINGTIRTRVAR